MLKIINVIEKDQYKREDKSIYGFLLEITLSNNTKYIISYWNNSIEEAKKELYNINWKNETLDALERFRCDEDEEYTNNNDGQENSEKGFYEKLMNKVTSNIDLSENDLTAINECMTICTVFKEFDYKIWAI